VALIKLGSTFIPFNPTSAAQKHDFEYQFTQCLLQRDTKYPHEWFAEMDRIRLQNHNVDYDDER
jgi:hypothetical protein